MSLTDTKIKSTKPQLKPFKLPDGCGLFLLIHPNGSKYWRYRYKYQGRERVMAIGLYPQITLHQARTVRDECKSLLAHGIDPIEHKKSEKQQAEKRITFEEVARKWCDSQRTWSADHRKNVLRTLERYLFLKIGQIFIADLTLQDLIPPIKWVEQQSKTEVASRLQQRTSAIMRYAMQNGLITHNPAQDLVGIVHKPKTQHRPALEFEDIPELLNRIDNFHGRTLTKLAIKLTLLVFIRSSELRFARWSEIDFDKKIWTIPIERTPIHGVRFSYRGAKMKTAHIVPLSDQAIALLKQIYAISGQYELVFIGDNNPDKPMSENTLNKALRIMGYDTKSEVCGHGFRAMACSALVESGLWSKDAIERQMSHQERNDVRAAYIHKALHLDARIQMVQWWANYLDAIQKTFVMPYQFTTAQYQSHFSA